jgi:tetrapyrrole methylase family protein/MazG family protein
MIDFDCGRYHDINDYIKLIAILRGEDGCPWDRVQTHESIRQNCLEEAYEVCEAIDEKDSEHLKEELGDLLMQVIFHAGIEEDAGRFNFSDVCDHACRKLIYRHPHVFGDRELNKGAEAAEVWEKAKRREHGQETAADAIDGVARTLPGLWRCRKMLKKAADAGYDEKRDLTECAQKFSRAAEGGGEDMDEAFAELIFAAVEKCGGRIDPELAVQRGCDAFAEKYRDYEQSEK